MVSYSVLITGRVQGVGFRYYTKKKADEIGLCGWVTNLPDGRVEVCFSCHNESEKNLFIDWLSRGPSWSQVENIDICEMTGCEYIHGFVIR